MSDQPDQAIDLPGAPAANDAPRDALAQADQGPQPTAETAMAAGPAPLIAEPAAVAAEPPPPVEPPTAASEAPPTMAEAPPPVEVAAAAEVPPPIETPVTVESPPPAEVSPPVETPPVAESPPPVEVAPAAVAEKPAKEEPKSEHMDWYILKVQSNREESIREGLLRRVAIAGLGRFFGDVIVPTEKVTEFKGGKKRVIKRKLYPGYLVVHMEINEDTWYLVRETPGIGDFTGATARSAAPVDLRATPMLPHEVARILAKQEEKSEKAPKLKIGFTTGERVKINEGTFENFEGEVETIDETNGRVTVMINIFGRSTPVELEYWQIETV